MKSCRSSPSERAIGGTSRATISCSSRRRRQRFSTYQATWSPPGQLRAYAVGNVLTLKLGKDSTASRPQTVTAAGWHHGKKKLYKATSSASGKGTPVEHRLHHNGHEQSQLQKKADSFRDDVIRHELNLSATMPGDPTLDPHMGLSLSGTGTIYDTTYQIDEIEFSLGGTAVST